MAFPQLLVMAQAPRLERPPSGAAPDTRCRSAADLETQSRRIRAHPVPGHFIAAATVRSSDLAAGAQQGFGTGEKPLSGPS